jgi:carbamoylphosphate synthase small subunit
VNDKHLFGKERWIMPPEKKTKPKKRQKRNIVDLIKTASRNPAFAASILTELNKEKVKAKDFHEYLKGLGYDGVSLEDCKTLLRVIRDRGAIQAGALQRAY